MRCGYLIYTDIKYLPLTQVLVDSLLEFSKYDIEITTTGFDYPLKHNRIFNKRRDDIQRQYFSEVCYFKNLRMAVDTDFDACVILDADIVANIHVDELMALACDTPRQWTLHAGHGCDPNNQQEAMGRLGVKTKSMPYVYSTYFACNASKPFLRECWDMAMKWKAEGFIPPNTGEALLNCMLWMSGVKEQVNCWLPFIDTLPHYFSCGVERNPLEGYYAGKALSYHVFHGEKDADKARVLFERLKVQDRNNPLLNVKPRLMYD